MGQVLGLAESATLIVGLAFVIVAIWLYGKRKSDWLAPVKIVFNRVDDIQPNEFAKLRIGVALLIVTVVLRFVNHLMFAA
ncbi:MULTISPECIES: hypothetical protein [Aliagarivorans]|uniref:hypothetical protein n=1 Tax=Aliagarivorans TaxID=882379 RepID=UPI0003FBF3AB|nr:MULTISPECIES: hypothetical protein [Aliagarivorans]